MIAEKIDMPGIKFGIAHSNDEACVDYGQCLRNHQS
jgi:hypothetical protein